MLFGSVLHSPAVEWFDSLEAALRWDGNKTQFITQFANEKMKYRLTGAAQRKNRVTYVELKHWFTKGGQRPSDADANAQIACKNQPIGK